MAAPRGPYEGQGVGNGRPDPTHLTTAQMLREVSNLKELIESRLTAMDDAVRLLQAIANRSPTVGEVVARLDSKFACIAEQMETVETATALFRTAVPVLIKQEIKALDDLHTEKLRAVKELKRAHFDSVQEQFVALEKRAEQIAIAYREAIEAALTAQKETAANTNSSAEAARNKIENSFTKMIEQTQAMLQAVRQNTDEKIQDIKGRLDRGEGKTTGAVDLRGAALAVMALMVSLVIAGVAVYGALRATSNAAQLAPIVYGRAAPTP